MKRRKSPYLQALEGDTTATKISKKWDPASATTKKKSSTKVGLIFLQGLQELRTNNKKNIPVVGG